MKGINKTAIAMATAKGFAKCKNAKTNPSNVNYRIDVHVSSSNQQHNYSTKKGN